MIIIPAITINNITTPSRKLTMEEEQLRFGYPIFCDMERYIYFENDEEIKQFLKDNPDQVSNFDDKFNN